ncbi:MAG TPA: RNA polymerase sigma factor [bacterium]|nr:RNA polymerase sigma factor [bacterium]
MDEKELVQKILRGDESAKAEFFTAHRERLYRNCVYLLGYNDPEAEDVVQETFLTAFEKLGEFEFRSSLATWLTQICIYKCHNRYRQRAKQVSQEHADLDLLLRSAARDRQRDRDQEAEKRHKLGIIEKCLEKLGKDCGEIVRLRDLQDKSYVEIGKVLKLPLGTVMSRLSRCKQALKTLVQEYLEQAN